MSEREILFRGKIIELCKYQGQWLEGFFGSDNGKTFIAIQNENGLNGYFCDSKTVGRYTGLTDKNGTRIFEGDIVICDYFCGVVCFQGGAWFVTEENNCPDYLYGSENPEYLYDLIDPEIIGNIYDNPELLKGE